MFFFVFGGCLIFLSRVVYSIYMIWEHILFITFLNVPEIIFWNTVKWFQVLLSNNLISIIRLHKVQRIYIYIYIYIYIFTNLLSTSIHGYQEKNHQEQEIKISRITARGKKENIIGQKKRKGQLCHTNWKESRAMQSVGQTKNKTHRKTLQCYNYKSA